MFYTLLTCSWILGKGHFLFLHQKVTYPFRYWHSTCSCNELPPLPQIIWWSETINNLEAWRKSHTKNQSHEQVLYWSLCWLLLKIHSPRPLLSSIMHWEYFSCGLLIPISLKPDSLIFEFDLFIIFFMLGLINDKDMPFNMRDE